MTNTEMMKGAKFNKNGVGAARCPITQVPKPAVTRPDEVLIRIEAVSICGTDVRALADPPAFDFVDGIIVGHEGCGIVEAVGSDVSNCKVGDKVVVHPNIWCGKCPSCRTGHINLCENFRHIGDRIDGAMAEYLCIEERMVYVIDSKVPSHIAALAEPLACVLNGTTTLPAHPGDEVVVLGGGPIGLIFAMLYKAMGAHVTVSEPGEYRRALALALGADEVINPKEIDLEAALRAYAPQGADLIVDAVGVMLPTAIQIAKKGARIAVFGVNQTATVNIPQYPITEKELTIRGTYITKGTFPLAVKIIESGIIPIDKLVTHRLPLEQLLDGIELMVKGTAGKVVIEI
ncbi:alcohol dehydrogenase catalytic domain-containing protein [Agathobaculum sp. NTUH-O15-33]|uniref:alcohol dehydrogenase catalytic domain-containing protein n=1 Tax=Agathobaculum sp. NTUH-O15-33 TaxID=3079302 RepID=UPI002958A23F|nr:alcohol dehydrogenase catalytic domain-containing protein [Agathobaculum sp. NTUH-O15-33]WNX84246.1 alcohol dehydrogenase catalytic domain-containing protein [Agathobaculum sp. NTUH-O15-33]